MITAAPRRRNPKRRSDGTANAWGQRQASETQDEDALPPQKRSTPVPNIPPHFEIKVTVVGRQRCSARAENVARCLFALRLVLLPLLACGNAVRS